MDKSLPRGESRANQKLRIACGSETIRVNNRTLLEERSLTKISSALASASVIQVTNLDAVHRFAAKAKRCILRLLLAVEKKAKFIISGKSRRSLFDAAAATMPNVAKPDGWLETMLTIVALEMPDRPQPACKKIVQLHDDAGLKSPKEKELVRSVEKIVAALVSEAVDQQHLPALASLVPDVPEDLREFRVPPGWTIVDGTIALKGATNDPEAVIPGLVFIAGLSQNVETSECMVDLVFRYDGRWHRRSERAETIATISKICSIASYGVAINSLSAKVAIKFLTDWRMVNSSRMGRSRLSQQLGWQELDGDYAFLVGHNVISPKSTEVSVRFNGATEGTQQLADSFSQAGDMKKWIGAIKQVSHYSRVMLTLYASLAAALVKPLHAPNVIINLAGPTTTGKTSTLKIAGSAFGDPDPRSGAMVKTLDGTDTYMERVISVVRDLPLLFDESRLHSNIESLIFRISEGAGRGRGSKEGLQRRQTWCSVVVLAGEQPITADARSGGAHVRVIELWGSPFGEKSEKTSSVINNVMPVIMENYGHAGPKFVQYVVDRQADWPEWRAEYQSLVTDYEQRARGDVYVSRKAKGLALISMSAKLFHRANDMHWELQDPVIPLWGELTRESSSADLAGKAMQYVVGWAHSNRRRFESPSDGDNYSLPVHQGSVGVWHLFDGGYARNGWLGFVPEELEKLLAEKGYDFAATVREWRQRDFLRCDKNGKASNGRQKETLSYTKVIDGHRRRFIAIRQSACEDIMSSE